jgi:hypothetical protein
MFKKTGTPGIEICVRAMKSLRGATLIMLVTLLMPISAIIPAVAKNGKKRRRQNFLRTF